MYVSAVSKIVNDTLASRQSILNKWRMSLILWHDTLTWKIEFGIKRISSTSWFQRYPSLQIVKIGLIWMKSLTPSRILICATFFSFSTNLSKNWGQFWICELNQGSMHYPQLDFWWSHDTLANYLRGSSSPTKVGGVFWWAHIFDPKLDSQAKMGGVLECFNWYYDIQK